jgi:hypothetical protein
MGRTMPIARDQTGNGRVLFAVQRYNDRLTPVSASLFLGNLNNAELKPITLPDTAIYVTDAAMQGDSIGWTQVVSLAQQNAPRLYTYNPSTETVTRAQVPEGSNPYSLRAGTNAIFFAMTNSNDIRRYDLTTNTITQVAGARPYNFDVYGTRMAYSVPNKGQVTLVELNGNRTIATWTLATDEEMKDSLNVSTTPSLSADKLLFSINGVGSTGTLHAHHLGIAWLDNPNAQFAKVWAKADQPVAEGKAARSWLWGPAPNYTGWEPYAGLPGGKRQVQYYDKSRMEVNDPDANPNDPFFVTNGLLVVEMVAGEVRLGETEVRASTAATITIAGDPRKDNPLTPSYGALRAVASVKGDNKAPDRTGQFAAEAMDVNGTISVERDNARAARYVAYVPQTGHNIPDLFNTYFQTMQAQYGYDWTFAMGYPITEAYWTKMRVGGRDYPVLIQAYQRRVMTYTPGFPAGWRVQQGNVGQHYFEWRYTLSKLAK